MGFKEKGKDASNSKEKNNTSHKGTYDSFFKPPKPRYRDIVCFKCQRQGHIASECPSKKIMFLKGNEVIFEFEHDSEDCPDVDDIYAVKGEYLVARCALNLNVKVECLEQRENIS